MPLQLQLCARTDRFCKSDKIFKKISYVRHVTSKKNIEADEVIQY